MERIKKIGNRIESLLSKDDLKKFKKTFKDYKTSTSGAVDDYCSQLFFLFFGSKEVVCHLEVPNFLDRK